MYFIRQFYLNRVLNNKWSFSASTNPLQRRGLKLQVFSTPLLWRGQGEAFKVLFLYVIPVKGMVIRADK